MSATVVEKLKNVTDTSEVDELCVEFENLPTNVRKKSETDLLEILSNRRNPEFIRAQSAKILGGSENPTVRKTLLEKLSSEKSGLVRGRIALTLARHFKGEARVTEIISQFEVEKSVVVRRMMSRALSETNSAASHLTLVELVDDSDEQIRYQAVKAIGTQKISEAVDALILRLRQEKQDVGKEYLARAILKALTEIGDEKSIREFIAILQEKDLRVDVYIAALRGLKVSGLKDDFVVDAVLETICHENNVVSGAATDLLVELFGKKKAAMRIAQFGLMQSAPESQMSVANALRFVNDRESIKYLQAMQGDQATSTGANAQLLLQQIGGQHAVDALVKHRLGVVQEAGNRVREFDEQALSIFKDTVTQAKQGFKIHLGMSIGIFAIGFLLLIVSLGQLVANDKELWQYIMSGVFGGAGFASVIAIFYIGPLERVQNAVANLVQTEIVFLGYIRQVTQISAMFEREYVNNEKFDLAELKKLLGFTERTIRETMPLVKSYTSVPISGNDEEGGN